MKTNRNSSPLEMQIKKLMLFLLLANTLLLSACTAFDSESLSLVAVATAQEETDNSPAPSEDGTPSSSAVGAVPSGSATPQATFLPVISNRNGYSWTRTNPGGGGAFNIVGAGPSGNNGEPGIILAGSDLAGAYISHDQGSNWELIGLYRGLDNTHASGIGFDPNNRNVLFIGTETGIYRSEDAGATVQNVLDDGYITDIELAATNSAIGYATFHSAYNAADGVIYKTMDNGRSWKQISNSSLPTGHHILKIIIDPNNENRLFVLTGEGRFTCGTAVVYESVDGGSNWTHIANDVGQIMDIALNPNDSNMLYVTTYGDVWDEGYECISDDLNGGFLHRGTYSQASGWQWQQVTKSSNVGSRNALIWLDSDDQQAIRLIDLTALELWESADNGAAWSLISSSDGWGKGWTEHAYGGSFNGDALTVGTDMSDPDALLWIDSQFAYATRNDGRHFDSIYTQNQGGDTWQSTGIDNIIMVDLAIDADSTHLYAGLGDMGCFRSDDYGDSWQTCNDPAYTGWWETTGGNVATIEADPTESGTLWLIQAPEMNDFSHTLLHSNDFGATWREIISWDDTVVPSGLSVDASSDPNNRTLFITVGGDVWRGKSDGSGWTAVYSCGGCRYTTTRQFGNADVVFAGGEAGLFRSDDGGNSWAEVGLPEMRGGLGTDFIDKYWAGVAAIEFDPSPGREEWVYATVFGTGGGLYRSTQRGNSGSWQKMLDNDFMKGVAISPADGNVIFATSSSNIYSGGYEPGSSGVLFSGDGGASWQEVNNGLPWPFANPIEIDAKRPSKVFMGSPGAGFYIGEFGQ